MKSVVLSSEITMRTVGLDPQGLAFVPGGAFAYVANQLSNTVSVIKTATNTVVTTVPVGVSPVVVAMVRR